jgi:pimeloyl-ACP methyl ester carboxylesterase
MSLHGTPGSRLGRWPNEELYAKLGVCVVTHDRAGYGRSTRRRGRSVADEADDVSRLADVLEFERFGVSGGSGGGPHALACAALLPDRVLRAICTVGIAPLGSAGLERDAWLAEMDPENVKEFGWAEAGEDVLSVELEREHAALTSRVAEDPSTILSNFDLSESDQAQLMRPEMRQVIRESTRTGSEWCVGVGGRRPRLSPAVGLRRSGCFHSGPHQIRRHRRARPCRARRVARCERARLCGQAGRRCRPPWIRPRA